MNIETIKMNANEAQAAFKSYREAVRKKHNKEDEALMRGYKALSKGAAVMDLHSIMQRAGEDGERRPRLAICRASIQKCCMRRWPNGAVRFGDSFYPGIFQGVWLPEGTLPAKSGNCVDAEAVVPIVPPQFRPSFKLSNYHILWEAEWTRVPVDPILLRHLSGSLYAVLATWDLTPLEQAILKGRL